MARAVGDVVVPVGRLAHQVEDEFEHALVALLAVGADQVGLADRAAVDDRPYRVVVVVDVDPVAHVRARAVELRPDAAQHIGDLPRDELLDVLVRPVVVRAVRDRGLHAERANPRPHQQVRACLRGAVRAGGVVRRLRREPAWIVEFEVAVDLVGGDVVKAHPMRAHGLQQRERTDEVGVHERRRVLQRVVVVRLRGEMHDDVGVADQLVDNLGVGNVAFDQLDLPAHRLEIDLVAGVSERIEHRDLGVRPGRDRALDEVRADESCSTGDQNAHDAKNLQGFGCDARQASIPEPQGRLVRAPCAHPRASVINACRTARHRQCPCRRGSSRRQAGCRRHGRRRTGSTPRRSAGS